MGTAGKPKPTVLIVEDQEDARSVIEMYFRLEGYKVLTAGTIRQAEEHLERMSNDEFAIALVDIGLGAESGFSFIKTIRDIASHHVLSYVYTGQEDRVLKDMAIKLRAHRIVIKTEDTLDDIRVFIEMDADLNWRANWDDLTGLQTRRVFEDVAPGQLLAAHRQEEPLSILFIDVNGFKHDINDKLGHEAGNQVLRTVGATIREGMRAYDHPFRYGGDEIVIVLPGVSEDDAVGRGDQLKEKVAETWLEVPGQPSVNLSISVGVATLKPGESLHELVERADSAMYDDKARYKAARRELPDTR